jgi:hypothetical protein
MIDTFFTEEEGLDRDWQEIDNEFCENEDRETLIFVNGEPVTL